MQNVNFQSVVEFIDYLPNEEREITLILRDLIRETLPQCSEKLSYNVPFYKINKTICFIWPASILWGKKKSYEGVRLGFNYGNQLDPNGHFLALGDRKSVGYLDLIHLDDLPLEEIKHYLLLSADLDAKKKNKTK